MTETAPRGVYTGAIGMIGPDRQAQFNVAIRTVTIDRTAGQAEYGVGGGVVWDSTPEGEYQECLLKAQILTERRPEFSLLETMLWEPEGGYFLFEEHLRRLGESAEYFGFPFEQQEVRRKLAELAASLPPASQRVRLLVSHEGEVSCEAAPIVPSQTMEPVRLELAAQPVRSDDPLLYHKTTHRVVYEAALAACGPCDDVLLHNQRGEITETSIANVVARVGDEFWTPPLECGLLPGVFRGRLLAERRIRECVLPLEMLGRIDELFVISSVRKWRRAVLARP
jgi:para-aminobenzoate synthetase / 4-amino-4-deoxychorismate lyase